MNATKADPHFRREPPAWSLALIGILLLSAVFYGVYTLMQSETLSSVVGVTAEEALGGPLTSVQMLVEAGEPANHIGREVVLESVNVAEVLGDYVFTVVSEGDKAMPVILFGELTSRQRELQKQIEPGDRVSIYGVVRRMEGSRVLERDPLLRPSQLEELKRYVFYISAYRVAPY